MSTREEKALASEAAAFKRAGWRCLDDVPVVQRHREHNEALTTRHIDLDVKWRWPHKG